MVHGVIIDERTKHQIDMDQLPCLQVDVSTLYSHKVTLSDDTAEVRHNNRSFYRGAVCHHGGFSENES